MNKLTQRLLGYSFDLIGGGLFAAVMVGVLTYHVSKSPLFLLPLAAVGVIFLAVNHWIGRIKWHSRRLYWGVIALLFGIMVCLHCVMAELLRLELYHGDAAYVISAAIKLTGIPTEKWYRTEYFARYQNQYGAMLLMHAILQVAKTLFGVTNEAAMMRILVSCNVFSIDVSVLTAVGLAEHIGRQNGQEGCGLRTMCICLAAPFLCLVTPYPYTDSLCLPFLMGGIALVVWRTERVTMDRGLFWGRPVLIRDAVSFFCIGLVIAIGYKIKGNLLILMAAAVLVLLIRFGWKKWLELTGAMLAAFLAVSVLFNAGLYSSGLLTREDSDRYKFPVTHWIMMDMDKIGAASDEIQYSMSFPTYEERKAGIQRRMLEKARRMGVSGMVSQMYDKAAHHAWNSGMFGMQSLLGHPSGVIVPASPSEIHEYVLSSGRYYRSFERYADAYWTWLELLMAASYFSLFRRRNGHAVLLRLFISGTMVFFMLWETNARYIFSSTLVAAVLAALQAEAISRAGIREWIRRAASYRPMFLAVLAGDVREGAEADLASGKYVSAGKLLDLHDRLTECFSYAMQDERRKAREIAAEHRNRIARKNEWDQMRRKTRFFVQLWNEPHHISPEELTEVVRAGWQLRQELMKCAERMPDCPMDEEKSQLDDLLSRLSAGTEKPERHTH